MGQGDSPGLPPCHIPAVAGLEEKREKGFGAWQLPGKASMSLSSTNAEGCVPRQCPTSQADGSAASCSPEVCLSSLT